MASLFESGGRWFCDIYNAGRPRRIRLGTKKRDAAYNYRFIEILEESAKHGVALSPEVVEWISKTPDKLIKRLQVVGLLAANQGRTVGDLVDLYTSRPGKPNTRRNRKNAGAMLERYFERDYLLGTITPADATRLKNWMETEAKKVAKGKPARGLAPATVARRIKSLRSMFRAAIQYGWIDANPFENIVGGKQTNPERAFYVTPSVADQIINEIPTPSGRLLFALGRWAGFRLPNEAYYLRWSDVDWANMSITFRSVKTEAYPGKEKRTCPIFRPLAPWLLAAAEAAPDGSDYVFPELRAAPVPRYYVETIIKRAVGRLPDVEIWPKPLVNLRAAAATEISHVFGASCESTWCGHGAEIALQHYIMALDDNWELATGVTRGDNQRVRIREIYLGDGVEQNENEKSLTGRNSKQPKS